MISYQEARVRLTNTKLNKLKSVEKNKTGTVLKINKKNFQYEELPHELFLTKRQKTKKGNALLTICEQILNLVKLKYLA